MYALFKDDLQITKASYFPIVWNHAFSEDLAYYSWIGENTKAEVKLVKGYEIREIKEQEDENTR